MAEEGKSCSEVYNIAHKLQSREIGNRLVLTNAHSQIKFRNFQLQEEFYTKQAYEIVQIISAGSIIFALAESGICAAFDRDRNKRLCYLNLYPGDHIQRLHYNRENNSLITLSTHASDINSINCRTTPLDYIRRAQPDAGFALFEGEKLTWPDFVIFDNINGIALTFSARADIYKVFDLKSYTYLYSISAKEIEGIKIASGLMLLISKRSACGSILPLKILSIQDGKILKSFHHELLPNKKVNFVELFYDKILVKQENECLQMVDVHSEKMIELRKQEFEKHSTILLSSHAKRLFLTFHIETVFVWNLQGEVVASYRNHSIRLSGTSISIVQLTRDEELLLSYTKVGESLEADKRDCSINIINILTGNCYAKIGGNDLDVGISCRNRPNLSVTQSTLQDVLEDITAIFYDEDRNEIYTGNTGGFVHVWSN
ncbi:hypothetical protein SUGI_1169690 [Cryptomeria japonica]|uniref:uncharacterized protein LOC131032430 n=1 Tax=Cryptomeria japonica TaxID=3369 RepID=UPI002414B402|nr:uncharacterized protein LOC131032430 [Cryptomeria japonica]GLJ54462.1 hypothetical protein SUGI_1169690 [Cryptomeria japonica]